MPEMCVVHVQELNHTEDPDDGLFWMSKEEAFLHFWSFQVCMVGGKPRVQKNLITDTKRAARKTASLTMAKFQVEVMPCGNGYHCDNGDDPQVRVDLLEGIMMLKLHPEQWEGIHAGPNFCSIIKKGRGYYAKKIDKMVPGADLECVWMSFTASALSFRVEVTPCGNSWHTRVDPGRTDWRLKVDLITPAALRKLQTDAPQWEGIHAGPGFCSTVKAGYGFLPKPREVGEDQCVWIRKS